MTIRVVLADDEPIIIKGLRKLIDWEELGLEIVGQAYDGRALLEAIEQLKPDIIISDITMPHMSGIDIIREINDRALPVKVIFISAYQEFSYAKDAVAFGAVDYLVKPVSKLELEKVLMKAASLIGQKDEELRRMDKLLHLEQRSRNDELQEWLVKLTGRLLSLQGSAYYTLQSRFPGPLHSIVIVEIDRTSEDTESWPAQETKLVDFALENVLTELMTEYGQGQVFFKSNRHVMWINHLEKEKPIGLAYEIKDTISSYIKLKVTMGVGHPVSHISLLADSYDQAELALQLKYYQGLNRVILYEPIEQRHDVDSELYVYQSKVIRELSSNEWGAAVHTLERLLDTIVTATIGNQELSISTCFSSILYIIQEVKKSGIQMLDSGFEIHDLQKRLSDYDTFAEMKLGIMTILEELHRHIDDKSGNKDKMVMAKVTQYIDEHYAEEITLESVSAIAFMNPYYFSSFFKKHMNQNFKAYVTELRMQHAIRMLSQTDMMVYEIAEKVGYNNPRHFSDMFKKLYGKLPQEFKQSLKK